MGDRKPPAMIPEHLWRFPTRAAIDALAIRFELPNHHAMQDWDYEVADPERIDAFISGYRSGELDEDERFALMRIILQSFEDLGCDISLDPRWTVVSDLLEADIPLHAHSIWYWSCPETADPEEQWMITPVIRPIWDRHRTDLSASG
ncbi:hypothetical protein [Sphingomonas colocasiae]|uniref:CdiI immunity protein domain-containing protein n=1 Tax=Sphingomonas colocasiae TaxID=1848973 RepID=A0ABS7PUS4_9SPHN|nr:hypothetical protein [Sphingomonas colocasiae]MBY8825113.1 hypothetical protein [Sphingomonas colocasiae]